jgi:hypothetical protein
MLTTACRQQNQAAGRNVPSPLQRVTGAPVPYIGRASQVCQSKFASRWCSGVGKSRVYQVLERVAKDAISVPGNSCVPEENVPEEKSILHEIKRSHPGFNPDSRFLIGPRYGVTLRAGAGQCAGPK